MTSKRIALYARSALPGALGDIRAGRQMARLREWAARHEKGAALSEFGDIGVSGATPLASRRVGRRLLEAAKAGEIRAVVVTSADRLGRYGPADILELHALGVEIVVTNEEGL